MTGRISATTLLVLALCACGGGGGASDPPPPDRAAAGTPVRMAVVELGTIPVFVDGPGSVAAFQEQRLRAPFNGVLLSLSVNVGDQVHAGQTIGALVAQSSYAAVQGAESMLRGAASPAARTDAQRAVEVARQNLVTTPLVASREGVVTARYASPNEPLSGGDSILSIEPVGGLSFIANVAQNDIGRVQPGASASIDLVSRQAPLQGRVSGVLPADTGSGMTMRVRIALGSAPGLSLGLFGTAHIAVSRQSNVPVVPRGALVKDDVTGETRVAVVDARNIAHWVDVVPGVSDSLRVQIVSPPLAPGSRVIVSGQMGLPDSTRVTAARPDSMAGGGGE